jgi:D-serine deaminase-like pyridoxal phosphate-dependent protein
LIGLFAGAVLIGACGGDDDDDSSSSTTTEPSTETTTTLAVQPEITVTTTTIAPTPTSVAYVTEGASVMVVNASRIDGAAGRMSDRLTAVGFTMVEPGNYSLGDLEVTQILYDPANPAALAVAQSLQGAFGGGGIQVVEMGSPPPVESGDLLGATVLVAMGNDIADKSLEELQGLAPPATEAPESTTGSSTPGSTTASTTA